MENLLVLTSLGCWWIKRDTTCSVFRTVPSIETVPNAIVIIIAVIIIR